MFYILSKFILFIFIYCDNSHNEYKRLFFHLQFYAHITVMNLDETDACLHCPHVVIKLVDLY